jgi:hypothetical protein
MKIEDVPQDQGMIDGNRHEICYAVDAQGRYVLRPSRGWEPKNVANRQAWELIREEVEATLAKIRAGKLSPLAYHMVRNQMSVGLLAKYVPYSRLRVRWHLRPAVFQRLTPEELKPYADLFEVAPEALKKVPEGGSR